MNYLNIHVSTLDSEAYQDASRTQQAVWLALFRFCAGQENGGVIRSCVNWSDAKWQRMARVTAREVGGECPLWQFREWDLHLLFYPVSEELKLKKMSAGGTAGAFRRWNKYPTDQDNSPPIAPAYAKGNGMKGKEQETSAPLPPSSSGPADLNAMRTET